MPDRFDATIRSRILHPMRIFKGDEITPPLDETGCKMRSLTE
jgi:hypothetical protein